MPKILDMKLLGTSYSKTFSQLNLVFYNSFRLELMQIIDLQIAIKTTQLRLPVLYQLQLKISHR
jgi:hypothetical protein